MSLLLAIDTATSRPSLAIGGPGRTVLERAIPDRHDLSCEIEHVTRALLREAGAAPRVIAGLIVADGPGSFTGLRIGVAFAKGLCRALGVPMTTIPSMLGAARAAAADGAPPPVVVEYDALRGDLYRAAYRFAAASVEVIAAPHLVRAGAPTDVAGAARATEADASAGALLRVVAVPGAASVVPDPSSWEPSYGRRAEAEVRRLQQESSAGRA